jgi:hypothetical protein
MRYANAMTVVTRRLLSVVAIVLAGMLITAAGDAPAAPEPDASGSYDIRICAGPCDFASPKNVLVRGVLILEKERFDKSAVPEPERGVLDDEWYFISRPRGCFILETVEAGRTYAGLTEIRFTSWSVARGKVRFNLYSKIDAWYDAEVELTPMGFVGKGYSWGVGGAAPGWSPDVVIGKRSGTPDRAVCLAAASKQVEVEQ